MSARRRLVRLTGLLPLALLLFTGLYMFALPYVAGRRRGRRSSPPFRTEIGDRP